MARRLPNQITPTPMPADMPGGSPGIPPDMSTKIHVVEPSPPAEVSDIPPPKKFKVRNDPAPGATGYPVLCDGCLTYLKKGKIVDSSAYNVDNLRAQGVDLEEVQG